MGMAPRHIFCGPVPSTQTRETRRGARLFGREHWTCRWSYRRHSSIQTRGGLEKWMNKELRAMNEPSLELLHTPVHAHPLSRHQATEASHILVTLRDPVDRFVSAFNTYACQTGQRSTLGGGTGGERTGIWDRRPCKRAPVWEDREVELSTKFTTQLTRTKNMTEAFFKCFPTVAHFAGQLDQKNPCGTQARSFMTFYERDASDENRRAFLDKIWERQRELGHVTEEEREVHIALVGDR